MRLELIKELIKRLILNIEEDTTMNDRDINILCTINDDDIGDLNIDELDIYENDHSNIDETYECIGSLIIVVYGIDEFCRIMGIVREHVTENIYNFLVDYHGKMKNHPIAVATDIDTINDIVTLIDNVYDGKYRMLYEIPINSSEYPTWAHHIISDDRRDGVRWLASLIYNADMDLLYSIWGRYFHDGSLCDVCYRGSFHTKQCSRCLTVACYACWEEKLCYICKCGRYI